MTHSSLGDRENLLGWKKTSLAALGTIASGGTPSKQCVEYWGGQIPWVTAKDMKSFDLDSAELSITSVGAENGSRVVPASSILILVRGMTLLKDIPICLISRPMAFNQDVRAIQTNGEVDARFLAYALVAR